MNKKLMVFFSAIFVALFLFIPKAETAFAEESLISNLSISVSQNAAGNLVENFDPAQESYDLGSIYYRNLSYIEGGYKLYYSYSAPQGTAVTVSHYAEGGALSEKDITSSKYKWSSALVCGKNTFVLKAQKDGVTKTYSFSVNLIPTLSSVSLSAGNSAVHFSPTFSGETFEYTAEISSAVTGITVEASAFDKAGTILYNGAADKNIAIAQSTDKITIKVTGGSGANALSTDYVINLTKKTAETVTFNTVPADASVTVYDEAGQRIFPDSFGGKTFTGLFSGGTCTYTVSKSGYVAKNGTVSAGTLDVTLESAGTSLKKLTSEWKNFRNSDYNMAITAAKTPVSDKAEQLWSKSFGSGFEDTVGLPLLIDGSVYIMYGTKIVKLSAATGNETASADIAEGFNWGYTPMTYAEGMLFLPLDNGTIQALNAETLESLWVYRDPLKGQSLSPIVYSEGYIYTGFWNSETANANFVCLSVTDEDPTSKTENKTPVWKTTQKGGFYWAGAVVVGDAVIFGSDDGEQNADRDALLCSLNKYTGETISKMRIIGDQRSSIAYSEETGKIYFTTKCGYLYSASVNLSTGVLTDLKYKDYGAQATSTPVYYKGRLYFGIGSGISASGSSGEFVCADAASLEKIYSAALSGYPQCSMLLSTAYESTEGKLVFYSSYNSKPGGIAKIETASTADSASVTYIFEPEETEHCICSMICDSKGNIYYKNDSGTLFAVKGNNTQVPATNSTAATSTETAIKQLGEAKPGDTVTMNIPNMETTVSRRVFIALMKTENVTLKLSGPYFEWYFNSDNMTKEPEETYFDPWVVVSSSKTIANGYFPDKKVLSVTFMEKYEIPGRAMLVLPRLSGYFESGALASSAGAALYEYTREAKTDANERFAFDQTRFAITVTEPKAYLITEAKTPAAVQSAAPASGNEKPALPAEDENVSEQEPVSETTEDINAEQYGIMAEALKNSVSDLRTLDSALKRQSEKYESDMILMTVVSAVGMLIVAGTAGTVIYLIMKRKIKNAAEEIK